MRRPFIGISGCSIPMQWPPSSRMRERVTVLGLCVSLSVCLLPLFLGDSKLIRRTEGIKRFGATLRRVL